MEGNNILTDIAERTGGDIYLGVVGPVRTGKSTFIKRFMELMVIPNIEDINDKERAKDELPQSGAGKTITTTEPKFVPNEAVEITTNNGISFKVRMVDCVGYTVDGALGYEEDDEPRMVRTPWFDYEVPFEEAAEIGTRKVITDHSTIGIVMTTDGSISDIPRKNYIETEERVINELNALNKPYIVLLNSMHPYDKDTLALVDELTEKYNVTVIPIDCENVTIEQIYGLLEEVLYEFPVHEVNVKLPSWVNELDEDFWLRDTLETAIRDILNEVRKIRDIDNAIEQLSDLEHISYVSLEEMNLGTGIATIDVTVPEELFYQSLSDVSGFSVEGTDDIMRLMKDFSFAKKEFDKVSAALDEVKETGYGVVTPRLEEMFLEEPELIRQGSRFGVKLKAKAPSLHIIRADITTELTPIIGTEKQCEELVRYMLDEFEEDPTKIWESNIFGKSLHDLVREGIQNKLHRMPENAQVKLQDTLQRIVNDGSGGLICIII
ncbi:Stage IV sporulation protein A [Candidatus Syntrophocurvum alkaliphilum]|uniref:Stage IV sporulation protein A n=1 Tax=Candidatus Syntrophocurvum alkaliphilum TaxID=2293317 RepID=A0A6I6DKL1_9FIRM|nr:stage IV sporulation protein A [Candidatus Syntrophocurvum alkaliphilum]QGT99831.1 Stage IV sporulation protein A [Candidatus Syntrophocurvum alkaliphilum]